MNNTSLAVDRFLCSPLTSTKQLHVLLPLGIPSTVTCLSCIEVFKGSMSKLWHAVAAVHKHVHVLRLSLASLQCCPCAGRQTSVSRCDAGHVARGVTWLVHRWVWWVLLYFLEVIVSGSNYSRCLETINVCLEYRSASCEMWAFAFSLLCKYLDRHLTDRTEVCCRCAAVDIWNVATTLSESLQLTKYSKPSYYAINSFREIIA